MLQVQNPKRLMEQEWVYDVSKSLGDLEDRILDVFSLLEKGTLVSHDMDRIYVLLKKSVVKNSFCGK